jgi:hypothetical protein
MTDGRQWIDFTDFIGKLMTKNPHFVMSSEFATKQFNKTLASLLLFNRKLKIQSFNICIAYTLPDCHASLAMTEWAWKMDCRAFAMPKMQNSVHK